MQKGHVFSFDSGWYSIHLLLKGQNPFSVAKDICRQPLTYALTYALNY